MGGGAMMKLRNHTCDHIRQYLGTTQLRYQYEERVWTVIEQLLNCLDEQQLENVPKMLAGEDIV